MTCSVYVHKLRKCISGSLNFLSRSPQVHTHPCGQLALMWHADYALSLFLSLFLSQAPTHLDGGDAARERRRPSSLLATPSSPLLPLLGRLRRIPCPLHAAAAARPASGHGGEPPPLRSSPYPSTPPSSSPPPSSLPSSSSSPRVGRGGARARWPGGAPDRRL